MRRRRLRDALWLLATASTLSWTGAAFADAATAEALFREGRKLLDDGQVDAACSKLAESQAQEASSGTLLNLALCHEKQHKLATAWAEYAAAARLANAQNRPERAEVATKKASELEPRLPRITIRSGEPVPGLKILWGQESLGAGAIGTAVPVDPGSYLVTAVAPGYQSWKTNIELAEAESKTVDVPALEIESVTESAAVSPAPRAIPNGEREPEQARTNGAAPLTGWIVGGAGAVALGVGGVFGVTSLAAYREADQQCQSHRDCSADAQSTRDRAETHAWVANIALGVGVLGVAAGAYFLLTGRRDATAKKTTFDFAPRTGGGALQLERTF